MECLEQRDIQNTMVFCCQACSLKDRGKMVSVFLHSANLPNIGWHSPDPGVRVHRGTLPFLWQDTAGDSRRQQEIAGDSRRQQEAAEAVKARRLHWGDLWYSLLRWVPGKLGWLDGVGPLALCPGDRQEPVEFTPRQLKTTECNLWDKGKKQTTESKPKKKEASA